MCNLKANVVFIVARFWSLIIASAPRDGDSKRKRRWKGSWPRSGKVFVASRMGGGSQEAIASLRKKSPVAQRA